MTFCLTKSSEKSKNSLIRGGGFINPVFQNLKIFLNKGGGFIYPGVFIFRSGVVNLIILSKLNIFLTHWNLYTTLYDFQNVCETPQNGLKLHILTLLAVKGPN